MTLVLIGKWPCFGRLTFENRGHLGSSIWILHQPLPQPASSHASTGEHWVPKVADLSTKKPFSENKQSHRWYLYGSKNIGYVGIVISHDIRIPFLNNQDSMECHAWVWFTLLALSLREWPSGGFSLKSNTYPMPPLMESRGTYRGFPA